MGETVTHTPADIVAAHQYLYYVLARPVWSDYDYDLYCKANGIEGGGGSDRANDYSSTVIHLAEKMLSIVSSSSPDDGCI